MSDNEIAPTDIIRLEPGERRLGQNEAAELQAAIAAVECPHCGAGIGEHCHRPAADGKRYETRLAHPSRIIAAQQARREPNADV